MEFEFDPAKSASNKDKHGIDFEEAQQLWTDSGRVTLLLMSSDEPRFLVIGKIAGRSWSAICTMRGGATRIISVPRSRANEVRL